MVIFTNVLFKRSHYLMNKYYIYVNTRLNNNGRQCLVHTKRKLKIIPSLSCNEERLKVNAPGTPPPWALIGPARHEWMGLLHAALF